MRLRSNSAYKNCIQLHIYMFIKIFSTTLKLFKRFVYSLSMGTYFRTFGIQVMNVGLCSCLNKKPMQRELVSKIEVPRDVRNSKGP